MAGYIRRVWDAVRGYDAAQDTRSSIWRPSGAAASVEVASAQRPIANRARDAVRNDPYAARIVDLWTANIVGAGITTRWSGEAHRAAWKRWAGSRACDAEGQQDLYGLQAMAMRAVVESGAVLVRMIPVKPSLANPIGLQLHVQEIDRLDASRYGMIGGNAVSQGIAFRDGPAPYGYWLLRQHPGATWMLPGEVGRSEFVSARDVLHVFHKRRPEQINDVSWLAPVLTKLRDLQDYEAAMIMKAKIEACLTLVATGGEAEETVTGGLSGQEGQNGMELFRDANGRPVETIEPGMILYRRNGGSVDVVNPSGSGGHTTFARRQLEAASVGSGLTYDQVSGDLTGANYSSLRAGKIEFRRLCEQHQYRMAIPMLVHPIAERFHQQGAMLGLWPAQMPDDVAHVPPAHEMIDPLKDTTALIAQVRAGFVPQPEAVGSFGYDFREVVEIIRSANEVLDKAGLSLDTDPRRVAKTGAAQDAGQMAAVELGAKGGVVRPAPADEDE
ncbi:phage portal protein [Roseomonas chloroacetimidivorans]|uniref:phage portal protein n=1 Tax=Roseomonas chloroacetimidivorans TaxID=1766656 RepID=UPI003C7572B9